MELPEKKTKRSLECDGITKICASCNERLAISYFYKRKDRPSVRCYCKLCDHVRTLQWKKEKRNPYSHWTNQVDQMMRKRELRHFFNTRDKEKIKKIKADIFLHFDNQCAKCGTSDKLRLDHHIPFSEGGRLQIGNISVLCDSCNVAKHNKMPEAFYSPQQLAIVNELVSTLSLSRSHNSGSFYTK